MVLERFVSFGVLMTEPGKLRFAPACESTEARIERSPRFRGAFLRVESFTGSVERTVTTQTEISGEGGALIFSIQGTALYRAERDVVWRVVPAQSVTFAETPINLLTRFAKGTQESLVLQFGHGAFPVLETWLSNRRAETPNVGRACGTQPIYPSHKDCYERFLRGLDSNDSYAEHMISSVVLELAAQVLNADPSHGLAPAPKDTPELLLGLIQEVRASPSIPWPLKEAADFVGYSPFHFSRIFKAQVGMGFHEFVDRTRTEYAVQLLTTTDHAIDVVASEAGFGTTQGLRESVKEYLGLVPSELRTYGDESVG